MVACPFHLFGNNTHDNTVMPYAAAQSSVDSSSTRLLGGEEGLGDSHVNWVPSMCRPHASRQASLPRAPNNLIAKQQDQC